MRQGVQGDPGVWEQTECARAPLVYNEWQKLSLIRGRFIPLF
jgi:hypothetical protein